MNIGLVIIDLKLNQYQFGIPLLQENIKPCDCEI
jgi:hypothetical protein